MTRDYQTGSAQVVLLSALFVAIIGALGFVFWQNYAKDKDVAKSPAKESTQMDHTDHVMKFVSKKHDISFEYPHDWKVSKEEVTTDDADIYASSVVVSNADGKQVALLGTSGQLGGSCSDDLPDQMVTNVISDSVKIQGIMDSYYSYTVVTDGANATYKVAYGLTEKKIELATAKCPGMEVNYKYIIPIADSPLGIITFGRVLCYDQASDFESLDDAVAYAKSDEGKKIRTMITSLKIGK